MKSQHLGTPARKRCPCKHTWTGCSDTALTPGRPDRAPLGFPLRHKDKRRQDWTRGAAGGSNRCGFLPPLNNPLRHARMPGTCAAPRDVPPVAPAAAWPGSALRPPGARRDAGPQKGSQSAGNGSLEAPVARTTSAPWLQSRNASSGTGQRPRKRLQHSLARSGACSLEHLPPLGPAGPRAAGASDRRPGSCGRPQAFPPASVAPSFPPPAAGGALRGQRPPLRAAPRGPSRPAASRTRVPAGRSPGSYDAAGHGAPRDALPERTRGDGAVRRSGRCRDTSVAPITRGPGGHPAFRTEPSSRPSARRSVRLPPRGGAARGTAGRQPGPSLAPVARPSPRRRPLRSPPGPDVRGAPARPDAGGAAPGPPPRAAATWEPRDPGTPPARRAACLHPREAPPPPPRGPAHDAQAPPHRPSRRRSKNAPRQAPPLSGEGCPSRSLSSGGKSVQRSVPTLVGSPVNTHRALLQPCCQGRRDVLK